MVGSVRRSLAVAITLVALLLFGRSVTAGTTGTIAGILREERTNAPLRDARVTVSSPSQVAATATDASGQFSFLTLAPDTYTLRSEKPGYAASEQTGIRVTADQQVNVSIVAVALQKIGGTTVRAPNALVRSGVTTSVYSLAPEQIAAGSQLGGGTNFDSALSAIAAVPGVVVPLGNAGWGQSIFIRGGDWTQTGNEIDGVPVNRSFDQYSVSALSSLGNQEVEVFTGGAPLDAQSIGLAGYVNQVIKTGTYPGYGKLALAIGAPASYQKASLEIASASPNRGFSYYLATGGYHHDIRAIDQFDGRGFLAQSGYGSPYNLVASGCETAHPSAGCYQNVSPFLGGLPLGPNGYAIAPLLWEGQTTITDRETIANLHAAVHRRGALTDDVQLLVNLGQSLNYPNSSMHAWGPVLDDVLNGTVGSVGFLTDADANALCPAPFVGGSGTGGPATTCVGGVVPRYRDQHVYAGTVGAQFTSADLGAVRDVPFADSPSGRPAGAIVDRDHHDGQTTGFALIKAQYQHAFSDRAYARVYGYMLASGLYNNGIVGVYQPFVSAFSPDYSLNAHARGVALASGYQVSPKHLLSLTSGYTTSTITRFDNFVAAGLDQAQVAYLLDSAHPDEGCYDGIGMRVSCDAAAGYILPPINTPGGALQPKPGSPVVGSEGAIACGSGPCQYYAINDGRVGRINTVRPRYFNASIADAWTPSPKLSVDAALRIDTYSYVMRDTNTLGNRLFANDYNASHCVSGTSVMERAYGAACPAGSSPAALSAISANRSYSGILEPRLGVTYALSPSSVLRASYGRFVQPPDTAAVQASRAEASTPDPNLFANFGFTGFARDISPEISYNFDLSWEQQFRGTDVSLRVTPFLRKTQNEFATITIDPKTGFFAFINGQDRTAAGIELALQKGDFRRDGFSLQLAYTYTWAYNRYKVFSNGGSFVAGINSAIAAFNAYTKAGGGSPCYTTAHYAADGTLVPGSPDLACGNGTIANPYYFADPGALLDPRAQYVPYSDRPGYGFGASASYLIPHVVALVAQYKKHRLAITPSLQFQAGSRYGSPLAAGGVAPDSCLTALPSAAVADPRYLYGATAGAGYDASSCTGIINTPDPFTRTFDAIGAFRQPNLINANMQITYELSRHATLRVIAANVFSRCWGGSNVPWTIGGRLGCNYQAGQSAGNFFNPGDAIQPGFRYPYVPTLDTFLQSVATQAANPFALAIEITLRRP